MRRRDGSTALLIAAANGEDDAIELLVAAGADIEARNDQGETALELAAKFKHRATVALLLQLGAQLEAGNEYYGMRWANATEGKTRPKPCEAAVDLADIATASLPTA